VDPDNNPGMTSMAAARAAANELKKSGVGYTEKEVQAQQKLLEALDAQLGIEQRVAELKKLDSGNASASTGKEMSGLRAEGAAVGEDELERLIANACKFPVPEPEPQVTLGGRVAGEPEPPKEPVDWRTRYLTFEKVRYAKPTEFLIDGFLAVGSITALAAPVAQRKSLIALNVAHALCTGEPLFGHFAVTQRPTRVVYLCPKMGIASFSTRLKQIGLDGCVGDTLFCQTMDEDRISLADLNDELPRAVVIIDTLTRFVEGDQNSSEAMAKFADVFFSLKRQDATVLFVASQHQGRVRCTDVGLSYARFN
jgi:hypothetical protein